MIKINLVDGHSHIFDGTTFDQGKDGERLSKQLDRVRNLMLDGIWRTLPEIESLTQFPQASISARLRDLRKDRFGAFRVERRRRGVGLYEYRVLPPLFDDQGQSSFLEVL